MCSAMASSISCSVSARVCAAATTSLRRYHDVQVSTSGAWRILKRVDLSRLPAYQRYQRHDRKWERYEKPLPGHAVQFDVKFIAPLAASSRKRYYQFTAIDDLPPDAPALPPTRGVPREVRCMLGVGEYRWRSGTSRRCQRLAESAAAALDSRP